LSLFLTDIKDNIESNNSTMWVIIEKGYGEIQLLVKILCTAFLSELQPTAKASPAYSHRAGFLSTADLAHSLSMELQSRIQFFLVSHAFWLFPLLPLYLQFWWK
jgi:hypothetical protein